MVSVVQNGDQPFCRSAATKPLPEAGVWGWVRFVNDANGGEEHPSESVITVVINAPMLNKC